MSERYVPLAEKLRPSTIDEIVGQEQLTGKGGLLKLSIEENRPLSILFWGPPGCGKTTLAKVYAKQFDALFKPLSAVTSGVAELKSIIAEIEKHPLFSRRVFLFIDEIHRYNKAQQDLILPYLEKGTFLLLGATTENPSFSLNGALLSRLRVVTLRSLNDDSLAKILERYEHLYRPLPLSNEARGVLLALAQGDGRYLLNMVESLEGAKSDEPLSAEALVQLLQKRPSLYDKAGEAHYNLISALHKAVRGSDPDAALYWFNRMLAAGEDPLFLARRLIRIASEDVGLADPLALQQAIAAKEAYQMLGSPEGELALAQVVVYLSLSPKSAALYQAFNSAKSLAEETGHLPPPLHSLNAPTKLMKSLGYGQGYQYDHDSPNAFSAQNHFPPGIERQEFYLPVPRGFEREMQKRIAYFSKLRKNINNKTDN